MFLLFFLVWIIFNGRITLEITLFGIVIAAVIFAFVCKFMDYSVKKELLFWKKSVYLARYFVVLVVEIIKANIAVLHLILSVSEEVEPTMIRFKANLKSDFCKFLLANSITLTPGTITVSLDKNEYVVHCLDKTLAEGIEDSVFVQMLEKLERMGESV